MRVHMRGQEYSPHLLSRSGGLLCWSFPPALPSTRRSTSEAPAHLGRPKMGYSDHATHASARFRKDLAPATGPVSCSSTVG